MNTHVNLESQRKVSILLIIGIFMVPMIFVWFLLRRGHSTFSRVLGFGWLAIFFFVGFNQEKTIQPSETPMQSASSKEAPAIISSSTAFSSVQACGPQSQMTGQIYKVNGSDNNLMSAPGSSGKKLVNEKATAALGKTHYLTIDNSTTVKEECNESGWSKVRVTDPEWLKDSHIGWVPSKALRGQTKNAAGQEEFTEADFVWDKKTNPHKKTIIAGVNKVHKENAKCKKIDPSSAYLSSSKGTAIDPVFFVTCGEGTNTFNAFFSKSEIEKGKTLSATKHVDKNTVIQMCEEYAKNNATHPSTVDFSRVMDLAVTEHPNGNTTVTSSFTAKNSFNLELKYNIRCLSNASGLFEANINEAK